MNRAESKYFNTALCMDEALITLLEKKDIEYITVKEICEKAGVNRSTFYLHYETIADLVNETAEMINRRFLSYFSADKAGFAEKISGKSAEELIFIKKDYLCPYLNFIRENKNIYRATFRNPESMQAGVKYGYLKQYVIRPVFEKFRIPEGVWKYYTAYYIEGIVAVIREWLNGGCKESVETIADVIEACVRPFDRRNGKPDEK